MASSQFSPKQLAISQIPQRSTINPIHPMGRGEDRMSHLPNEILQSILCLMPLKYAIRTSTLSKRWRHLWQINLISSTSLQFGEDFSCGQSPKQFSDTLDRYLQLHGKRNLHKFAFLFSPFEYFFPNLENWVRTVITKGVKELDIDLSQGVLYYYDYIDDRMPFVMPDSLFNGNSLTHLSLSRCNFSDPFDFATFAGLNSLSLDSVDITDDILENILQTCISLESISLKRCDSLEIVKFVGEELRLKKLVMVDCLSVCGVEISAPKLDSVVFHGSISIAYSFGNVTNVTNAYLCSCRFDNDAELFSELLSGFSHVKILTLSSFSLTHVVDEEEYVEDNFPLELNNLQELQLILNSISEELLYCVFSFFCLCPTPVLEKLFIQCPSNLDEENDLSYLVCAERDIPDEIFQNLKWIRITKFKGSPLELKLVKFLLNKATLLESIFLVMDQCDKLNNSLSRRIIQGQISILPKASIDARIAICGPSDHDCTMNPTHITYYHEEKYRKGTTVHLDNATIGGSIPLDQEFL